MQYSFGDWITLVLLETAGAAVIFAVIFGAPLSDWWLRRRMRKKREYAQKLRQMYKRKYEMVGKSRWHGKN